MATHYQRYYCAKASGDQGYYYGTYAAASFDAAAAGTFIEGYNYFGIVNYIN